MVAFFPQSLVLAFLHLMNTQLERTLDFLSGVPDPTGKSALEYVIKIWCARQPEFFGVYDSKVRYLSKVLFVVCRPSVYYCRPSSPFFSYNEAGAETCLSMFAGFTANSAKPRYVNACCKIKPYRSC